MDRKSSGRIIYTFVLEASARNKKEMGIDEDLIETCRRELIAAAMAYEKTQKRACAKLGISKRLINFWLMKYKHQEQDRQAAMKVKQKWQRRSTKREG